ncbi:MAG: DUF169 domain-containing protein [Euryarchaeota archaeon]|nr:DUF169 domain-containing protein [Euryarchaeota archaeon]
MKMDAKIVGERLTRISHLPGRALFVFGSENVRKESVQISKVDRCMARAVYKISMDGHAPPVYFGPDARTGICPGGQGWCGIATTSQMTKFFISTGRPDFMNGAAEYLKPDPAAAERFLAAPGKIAFPYKYLNIAGWDQLEDDQDVLSLIMIGNAESIRNLGGLIQYVFDEMFKSIVMPSGPSCASMITYAAGLSEKAPRDTAFIGPVDPTGNVWFPPDMMSMAIPFDMARKMVENIEDSFLTKRAEVAFPVKRLGIGEKAEHDQ